MVEHLGHEHGEVPLGSNVRNGTRTKTVLTEIVLSLTARGLTTGEVAAHFEGVYGAKVSKDTISRITDKVVADSPSPSPGASSPRIDERSPGSHTVYLTVP